MHKISQAEYLIEFKRITDEMYETTKRKNSDYTGDDGDAFKNFTLVELMGAGKTEQGFLFRMSDKMMRFAGFIRNGTLKVADEKIEDTILDLAVYCILFVCYRRAQKIKSIVKTTTTGKGGYGGNGGGGAGNPVMPSDHPLGRPYDGGGTAEAVPLTPLSLNHIRGTEDSLPPNFK